jgi:hypothetical protein
VQRLRSVCSMFKCNLQQKCQRQYCISFIYIWFIRKHIFSSPTWRKKRRYCHVSPGFFLTIQSKEMVAKSLEAIQVPQWLSSDVLCTRKRKKNSFYLFIFTLL